MISLADEEENFKKVLKLFFKQLYEAKEIQNEK